MILEGRIIPILILCASVVLAKDAINAPSSKEYMSGLKIENRTDHERIQFLLNVALAYYNEKDYDSSINAYERILKIDPTNKEARFIVSQVYMKVNQYGKAEKTLMNLMKEYPNDFQLLNNLAWLYATAGDPAYRNGQKAIKLAQEALVLSPYDHHVWSTLGEAYYVNGDYEKAYRAITQMANLAAQSGKKVAQGEIDAYNEQIRKCRRAWETEKALRGENIEFTEEE